MFRRGGTRIHASLAGPRDVLWRRRGIGARVPLQLELPLVHATRVLPSSCELASALCLHIVVTEVQLVAQLPVRVGRLAYLDW